MNTSPAGISMPYNNNKIQPTFAPQLSFAILSFVWYTYQDKLDCVSNNTLAFTCRNFIRQFTQFGIRNIVWTREFTEANSEALLVSTACLHETF